MNSVVDYDKLRNGLVDEKIWDRDEVLKLFPYHICLSTKIANAKAEDILEWLYNLKHRWVFFVPDRHNENHVFAFSCEENVIIFALKWL